MYYVYILQLKKGGFYIGYTENLRRRFRDHQKEKGEIRLIYYEAYQSEKIARQREQRLKYYGSARRALKARITA